MSATSDFFEEIDRRWRPVASARVPLRIIGSGALMLQARYQRGTKDSDVLHASDLPDDVRRRLLELAGPGTDLHTRHRLYIDIVANGVPFLPHVPRWHLVTNLASLVNFEISALDVVDVVVSKLKRFNANDVSDVEAMIDDGLVSHDRLLERFRDAVDCFSGDARAEDLPKYVENLHRVERDVFGVEETEIELPSWI